MLWWILAAVAWYFAFMWWAVFGRGPFRFVYQHNHQFRVRPFMAPVYIFWDKVVGYRKNPLEKEAERAERD